MNYCDQLPPASCYIDAYEFTIGGSGSSTVIANILLNLFNSRDFPLTFTYGIHGTLDDTRRKIALDCIVRYTYRGEKDRELIEVGRKLAKEYPNLHIRNL